MFGYVVANIDKLSAEERQHYRSCYCGLCKSLGSRHGAVSRVTLTYDMAFLVLLLSALYNTDETVKKERCAVHPLKRHKYWRNEFTDYAADMNVALAYYNFIDKWTDEKKICSLYEARLFEREYKKVAAQRPRQCGVIGKCLGKLAGIEKSGELNADIPANCFGELLGEVFVMREDEYAERLRSFGKSLGRLIYIMDACMDLKKDIRKERYNPMVATPSENFSTILNLLAADCTETYRQLPVGRDAGIIENILYSGVWTRYEAENSKARGTHRQ